MVSESQVQVPSLLTTLWLQMSVSFLSGLQFPKL